MKRIYLFIVFVITCLSMYSNVVATGVYKKYENYPGVDYIFFFNGIDAASSLKYEGLGTTINWYKFDNPLTSISNQAENFNIEDVTGYILDVDGQKTTIWVIDYSNYLPVFTSLVPENNPGNQCSSLDLNLTATVLPLTYKDENGTIYSLDRKFRLTYNTKEWVGNEWKDKGMTEECTLPSAKISLVEAPLCDTKFKIEGDQYAEDLSIQLPSVESSLYSAVSVACHITSTTLTRTEKNEDELPENTTTLSGSAPLDILFESNANLPTAQFFYWEIFKDNQLIVPRSDQDQRYKFTEKGHYKVKVTVSNNYCTSSDTVFVDVSESALEVPPAFSPNGDGKNDEFRVLYKSIANFKMWVFTREGHQVYVGTDPQRGWDGRINGNYADTGTYLYIVEAVGTDGIQYKKKGVVHLFSGKEKVK